MKTFQQFMTEVYDPSIQGRSQITKQGEGGRIGRKRKQTDAEKRRVRSVGGGKTVTAKTYKDKSDIGVTNRKRSPAGREQQPTRERGSAALSAKEAQKKAYLERKAKEKGAQTQSASELLAKKAKPKTDPNYKPRKTSGLTTKERAALYKKGERTLRDITLEATGKKKEGELKHPITQKEVTRRNKKK